MSPAPRPADPGRPLAGRVVALTRGPDRAGLLGAALRNAGATVLAVPVIDFSWPDDVARFDAALAGLGGGRYGWLAVTSATTVTALTGRAGALGRTLPDLLSGGCVRVAAVGPATADALAAAGVHVDLVPDGPSSAETLAAAWPAREQTARPVLLPHSDLAAGTLHHRLTSAGWAVETVTAYHTVDYPADADRSLSSPGPRGDGDPRTVAEAQDARPDAVVATSPSTARRWLAAGDPCPLVAIGTTTARAAEEVGTTPAAVAATTRPEDLVRAVVRAVHREPTDPLPAADPPQ
ncbi:hypothetical protein BKD30_01435 [Tersicoccus phoenicis]|uniref:Uroporphyrinogen-III synthase n=1 Tax=Tersicoccus phoenicis TaxID=554083 RepID=A0A1R1LNH3_9MICC|nr:uroporphyrinogen-III synthase [Tersicoccus phoenicis]OMH29016.1 hypothetical protein BKD30_01435 [Tersicoccus phoenicis]